MSENQNEPTILDEIDATRDAIGKVKQEAADGVAGVRQVVDEGIAKLEQVADQLKQEVAGAQARQFPLKLASGREIVVSDRDGLQLFAATVLCIAVRSPSQPITLASGQTETVSLVDLVQLARLILAGPAAPATPAGG